MCDLTSITVYSKKISNFFFFFLLLARNIHLGKLLCGLGRLLPTSSKGWCAKEWALDLNLFDGGSRLCQGMGLGRVKTEPKEMGHELYYWWGGL